jgi:uncharacterized membrane protein
MDFFFGFIGSFLVAFPAYLKHKLSRSGLWGAILLGTGIWGFGTSLLWVIMIDFFLTSTLVTNPHKTSLPRQGRNIIQVFANSGSALLCAVAFTSWSQPTWLLVAVMIFAGSNGDT